MSRPHKTGTVYLLHLSPSYRHARHYVGFHGGSDPAPRIEEHRAGRGARLCQVAVAAGSDLLLVRTWTGTRKTERSIKNRHDAPRLCPICNPAASHRARAIKAA